MASFTDQPVNFNPYIQQVPVDAEMAVGLQLQKDFDAGVQRVQGYVNTLNGFDIAKDATRKYLQGKIGELRQSVSNVAGDFSDQRLINQIGGAASKIARDSVVENGILSTAAYRKGLSDIEGAKKEGKWSPANEWAFQAPAQQWLSDNDATTSFNGKYTPHIDISKKILDTIKSIDPDSKLTQIPYKMVDGVIQVGADGFPKIDEAMIEQEFKGKTADKIMGALSTLLDDADMNQIAIDGQYHYRNTPPQEMANIVLKNSNSRLENYHNILEDLKAKQMLKTNDRAYQEQIADSITHYKKLMDGIQNDLKDNLVSLSKDPESFKASFYSRNFLEQTSNALSSSNTSYKYLTNPYRQQQNWQEDFNQKAAKAVTDAIEWQMDYKLKVKELEIKEKAAKKEKPGLIILGERAELPVPPGGEEKTTESTWQEDLKIRQTQVDNLKNDIISKTYPGISRTEAEVKLNEARDSWQKGEQIEPKLSEYFSSEHALQRSLENKKAALVNIMGDAEKAFPKIDNKKLYEAAKEGDVVIDKPVIGGKGRNIHLTKDDIVDFAVLFNVPVIGGGDKLKGQATESEKRLRGKFGEDYDKIAGELSRHRSSSKFGMNEVRDLISSSNILEKRDLITTKLTGIDPVTQPVAVPIHTDKPEERQDVAGKISTILLGIEQQKGGVSTPYHFDIKEAKKMNDASFTGTKYSTYQDKHGDWFIVMQSPGESEKSKPGSTQYIPTDAKTLHTLFDTEGEESAFSQPFTELQRTLNYTNGRTTNVKDQGPSSSYYQKVDFPNVKKYGVTADVEGTSGGRYQLRLNYFDKVKGQWVSKVPPKLYENDGQIDAAVQTLTDDLIEQIFQLKK